MRTAQSFCHGDWLLAWVDDHGVFVDHWRRVDHREEVTVNGVSMLKIVFCDWLKPGYIITTHDSLWKMSNNSYAPH